MEEIVVRLESNQRLVAIELHSSVGWKALLKAQGNANRVACENALRSFLLDVRGATNPNSLVEDIQYIQGMTDSGLPRATRIAILTSTRDTSYNFMETAAQNRGLTMRRFMQEEEAVTWLAS